MPRWVIPACGWVAFFMLLCCVSASAQTAGDEPGPQAADSAAADSAAADSAAHTDAEGSAQEGSSPHSAGAAHHGGADAHHDPYDLGHQNATEVLEDPSEFRSDLAIWTLVVFLCLSLALLKFAWRPIMDGLEKREQSIASMIEEAKASAEKAAEQMRQYEARLAAAGEEAREMIAQAHRDAEVVKDGIVTEARQMARRERERAVSEIETAKKTALQEITNQSADLAVAMAGQILERQLNTEDRARLIREALDQLPSRN